MLSSESQTFFYKPSMAILSGFNFKKLLVFRFHPINKVFPVQNYFQILFYSLPFSYALDHWAYHLGSDHFDKILVS